MRTLGQINQSILKKSDGLQDILPSSEDETS